MRFAARLFWTLPILATVVPPALAVEGAETVELSDITVTSTRVEKSSLKVPAAVSTVSQDEIQIGHQQLGLDEAMLNIPGLFFQDRYNFAQDLRISIRGSGARSNFGIRGIRIYSDEIPLTMADGQSNVDEIDLGSMGRIEVLRGSSGSLYGSSSGGIINLQTEDGPETPFVQAKATAGEYDFQNYQLKSGGQLGRLNYMANASFLTIGGYRQLSEAENRLVNTKFRYDIDDTSDFTVTVSAVDSPLANDPGGLTATQVRANRKQATAGAATFQAGEALDQQKLGLVYDKRFGDKHEIKLRNYYLWRGFESNQPVQFFGVIEFDRFFFGGGGQYTYTDSFADHDNRLILGFDVDSQRDDRQRYNNDNGIRGTLRLDQVEKVLSRGFYVQDEFSLFKDIELTAGARYDVLDYEVDDNFLTDPAGDDSDDVTFSEWSPMAGIVWSPREWFNLYGNVSWAFETPSMTEFANPANGGASGGLNSTLSPQTSTSYEVGLKGVLPGKFRYDVAAFHIDLENEIVTLVNRSGRTFSENAQESTREGVEAALSWQPFQGLTANVAYTFSDFTYDEYLSTGCRNFVAPTVIPPIATCNLFIPGVSAGSTSGVLRAARDFSGKRVPGIPEHQFHAEISYFHASGFYVMWDMLHVGKFYTTNANGNIERAAGVPVGSAENESYQVANFSAGRLFEFGAWEINPYVGLNNMFNEEYNGNVRINDANFGYFEPAPEQNFFGGVNVRYNFNAL
jgi:iron complex outermembrane receptor protein